MNRTRMWRIVETLGNNGERLGEALWSHFSNTLAPSCRLSNACMQRILHTKWNSPRVTIMPILNRQSITTVWFARQNPLDLTDVLQALDCRHALHIGAQPTLISRCAIEKIIESESRPPVRPRIAKTAVRLTTLPVRSLELLKHQQRLRVRKVVRYSQHDLNRWVSALKVNRRSTSLTDKRPDEYNAYNISVSKIELQSEKRRWVVNCYTGIRSVQFLHGGIACLSERYYRSRIMGDTLIRR
ncbi:hypothetical protein ALC53_05350 [Atta colombica]|uniref:Uncharacterized protein n=1 Tax=Atta colombica TaxID=520822 RepID=A0A195BHG1_9HYME|nr:hypothetical protein ALC53_05350 [Atta colombica]